MNGLFRIIAAIERGGNKLPHPFWLFWILAGVLGVSSLALSLFGVSVTLPDSDEVVVQNLLSLDGIAFAAESALKNFAEFPPLAVIVVVFLGVSIAEKSGFLTALLRITVVRLPARWVTFAIVYSAMISHVMSDSAFLVMLPLGALAFRAAGRSPVLGVMVAYTATAVATSASPLVTPSDALRTSLISAAAQLVDANYVVTPVALYYFSATSSLFLAVVITLVVELLLAKRPDFATVSAEHGDSAISSASDAGSAVTVADGQGKGQSMSIHLMPVERRALKLAGVTFVFYVVLVVVMLLVPGSPLIGEGGSIVESVVVKNIAVFISLLFALVGFVYGRTVGTVPSLSDVPEIMSEGISRIAPVIVLFFAVSQFLAYFNWTGIGKVLIVGGADLIRSLNAHPLVILLAIVLAICVLNMFISSGSATLSILAPVLVPMMMYVNMSPEAAMVAFQIGDSVTNPVTPMLPYFVLALGYIQQYWKHAGIGTLMSFTVPIAFVVLIAWSVYFAIWYSLGIPLGPGVDIR
ncbi:MAG: AbgT family transporter [Hyphomicrobiales bacterium]|nr:MAG: AbgT family transporter [Hyphomicrobiales bacterium]